MSGRYEGGRRRFLKISGATAAGSLLGSWSFTARADFRNVKAGFAQFTDTLFTSGDKEGKSNVLHHGYMIGETYALADDLVEQTVDIAGRDDFLLVHSGNLIRSGKKEQLAKARTWLGNISARSRLCVGSSDPSFMLKKKYFIERLSGHGFAKGCAYYSHEHHGVRFLHLDTSEALTLTGEGRLADGRRQLKWLEAELQKDTRMPAVLVMHSPLFSAKGHERAALADPDREGLLKLLKTAPQAVLVLCGGAMQNRAEFIQGTNALCLITSSPAAYPCGCRWIEISASGKEVRVDSRFIQTRLLNHVEKSFYFARPTEISDTLGQRNERSFISRGVHGPLKVKRGEMCPAQDIGGTGTPDSDVVRMAVLADTHLCLDKYVTKEAREEYELTGHFAEEGSKALYDDVLESIKAGRHRVEFYDALFGKDPKADANYDIANIDSLLVCGDLAERGKREEAKLVLDGFDRLPPALRKRTRVAIGNHDMYTDFTPRGIPSSDEHIAEVYDGFGTKDRNTDYVAHVNEWLSLIVLNTTIPAINSLGISQDRIDWLEDRIKSLEGRAVMVASHHPIYPISIVPPLMNAYLMTRTHFRHVRSAARYQLHDLFARCPQVKLVISGHYHGVCVDQFEKTNQRGNLPDDAYTTHIQVPCLIEYPCGYRLLKIWREKDKCTVDYQTAYTTLHELREESRGAPLFKYLGTETRVPPRYEAARQRVSQGENASAYIARLDPYDLIDLNVRGFKDGTANLGKGNSGKPNIAGRIEFTI